MLLPSLLILHFPSGMGGWMGSLRPAAARVELGPGCLSDGHVCLRPVDHGSNGPSLHG
jgi:hypothetical protein